MIDRVEDKLEIKPKRLIADTAYGSAAMLNWVVEEKDIETHIPVWDKSNNNEEVFDRPEFLWDDASDYYHCPGGRLLKSRWRDFKSARSPVTKANTIIYRSRARDCENCHLKLKCCPNTEFRKLTRSIYESSRDVARNICKSEQYQQSRNDRKKVEALFAHLKQALRFDRLRLRGITGARDEFLMAATVQNLKKLAQQRYKPPNIGGGASKYC